MAYPFAELTFTPQVRSLQRANGTEEKYQSLIQNPNLTQGGTLISQKEADFIGQRDTFYQATVSETDWPYVQLRGGPRGFLKVIDEKTLAYADFRGNRQYISVGNMLTNNRISIIMVDYPNRRRIKILGHTEFIDAKDNPELIAVLHDETYKAKPERAVIIHLDSFDWNCPSHITPRFTLEEMDQFSQPMRDELASVKAQRDDLLEQLSKLKNDVK